MDYHVISSWLHKIIPPNRAYTASYILYLFLHQKEDFRSYEEVELWARDLLKNKLNCPAKPIKLEDKYVSCRNSRMS